MKCTQRKADVERLNLLRTFGRIDGDFHARLLRSLCENQELQAIVDMAAKKMGARSHRLGCECGGSNHDWEWPCFKLTNAIREAASKEKTQEGKEDE